LSSLPAGIVQLKQLKTLLLHGNPELNIPAELLGEDTWNNKDAQKILAYLRDSQQQPQRQLNETKMLVVGQGGVGKSSLINHLIGNPFDPSSPKTGGIDIHHLDLALDQRSVRLNIWDFGGQEVMHATHQFFLTQRSLYLFVLDARIERHANKPDYWLNLIEQYASEHAPIIIAINKIDDNPILSLNESAFKKKYNIKAIIRTSCAHGTGLAELQEAIHQEVDQLPHVSDTLPASWFNVKQTLEVEKQTKDIIEFTSFADLCASQSVAPENCPTLLGLLHDLGTVLNFYGKAANQNAELVLEETNILNPEWVTSGVYAILNSEMVFNSKGLLKQTDLFAILDSKRYPNFMAREFILGMMKQFELAFQIGASQQYLVPDLLSEDEPTIKGFIAGETLNFEYRYTNFFPSNIFTRFIVRQHERIKDRTDELWRNGVVIHFEGMEALVRADGPSKRVTIEVQGNQNRRRELLAIVRSTFDAIHGAFAKLRVHAMIPIPDEEDAAVSYEALLIHERENRSEIFVEDLGKFVQVAPLLAGVDGPKSNRELLALMRDHFDIVEINQLMFEMGIDYEDFEGYTRGKMQYVINVLRHLQQRGKVDVFLAEMKRSRPDIRL
jgi:internalin A